MVSKAPRLRVEIENVKIGGKLLLYWFEGLRFQLFGEADNVFI